MHTCIDAYAPPHFATKSTRQKRHKTLGKTQLKLTKPGSMGGTIYLIYIYIYIYMIHIYTVMVIMPHIDTEYIYIYIYIHTPTLSQYNAKHSSKHNMREAHTHTHTAQTTASNMKQQESPTCLCRPMILVMPPTSLPGVSICAEAGPEGRCGSAVGGLSGPKIATALGSPPNHESYPPYIEYIEGS